MSKKKLLILVDWYLPAVKAGGPVRSVSAIAEKLKFDFEVYVLTTDRDLNSNRPFENVSADCWLELNGVFVQYVSPEKKTSAIKKALRLEWSAIYLNSLFSFYFTILPLIFLMGRKARKVVLAPRGMFGGGALKIKNRKKKAFLLISKAIGLFENIIWHASSDDELDQIKSIFSKSEVKVISNLSSIKIPPFNTGSLRKTQRIRLVFVARVAEVKNLLFFLNVLAETKIPYSLDIFGPIEEEEYWLKCENLIKLHGLKVHYQGNLENEEVVDTIAKYDLFILPTLGENFGHSILESLAASVLVLISDKTPWLNLESIMAGKEIPLSKPALWLKWLQNFHEMDDSNYQKWRKGAWSKARDKLSQEDLVKKYVGLFSE